MPFFDDFPCPILSARKLPAFFGRVFLFHRLFSVCLPASPLAPVCALFPFGRIYGIYKILPSPEDKTARACRFCKPALKFHIQNNAKKSEFASADKSAI